MQGKVFFRENNIITDFHINLFENIFKDKM